MTLTKLHGEREDERNRLLRHVDWRLLLPAPAPRRSACSAGGSLRRAIDLISGGASAIGAAAPGSCDLVVAPGPTAAALRVARELLRPGGWCYVEGRPAWSGGRRALRRKVERAEFEAVACYRPWPCPAHPYIWLPLDAPGAQRYFWSTRSVRPGLLRRLGRVARRLAWHLAPACAVAQKPPCPSLPTPRDDRSLLELVRDEWPSDLGPRPERLSCLLLTGGNRSISKCVALVFAEPDPRPRLAVKLPRVPQAVPALAREASVLDALHRQRPGELPGVPRMLFHKRRRDDLILGQTALVGTPVEQRLRHDNLRQLALAATEWLADLAWQPNPRPSRSWWERIAEPALAEFTESLGATAGGELVRRVQASLMTLGPLPGVAEQRDFSPWNVLIDSSGRLIVLDWESAELDGLPALDLIYFITYLAFRLDGVTVDTASQRLRKSYRRTLDCGSVTGSVRAECLARYIARVGLDREVLGPLAVLTWLIHARSDYRRFAADVGGPPGPDVLRRSVFLCLLEEEVRAGAKPSGNRETCASSQHSRRR